MRQGIARVVQLQHCAFNDEMQICFCPHYGQMRTSKLFVCAVWCCIAKGAAHGLRVVYSVLNAWLRDEEQQRNVKIDKESFELVKTIATEYFTMMVSIAFEAWMSRSRTSLFRLLIIT